MFASAGQVHDLSHLGFSDLDGEYAAHADAASATAWIAGHSNADIAAYLRGKPASTLLKVGVRTIGGLPNTTTSGPIPEGTVVATDPIAAILAGNYVKTPLLAGMMWGFNLLVAAVAVMAMALVGKHWVNIQRLLAGQESKIGSKKK